MSDHTTRIVTYKYRLYPNKTQITAFSAALDLGCHIYNDMLNERIQTYRETGKGLSWQTQGKLWGGYRRDNTVISQVFPFDSVTQLVKRVDLAFKAFFERREQGVGFPKPQSRKNFRSLDFRYGSGCKWTWTDDKRAKLRLYGIGEIKVHAHRPMPENSRIKRVTVLHDYDDSYWACLQVEKPFIEPPPHAGGAIGIDIGLAYLLAFSDGQTIDNPRWYKNASRQRRIIGRQLDRQRRANNPQNFNPDKTVKAGVFIWHTSNRQKRVLKVMRREESKIARRRHYFWDVLTTQLTRSYSVIALEALTLEFMQQNKRTAMGVYDAGFGMFWRMLEYKSKQTGTRVVYVPPEYTSQTCSGCGYVSRDNRRTQSNFTCVSCGHHENADVNAAKNILKRAGVSDACQQN